MPLGSMRSGMEVHGHRVSNIARCVPSRSAWETSVKLVLEFSITAKITKEIIEERGQSNSTKVKVSFGPFTSKGMTLLTSSLLLQSSWRG